MEPRFSDRLSLRWQSATVTALFKAMVNPILRPPPKLVKRIVNLAWFGKGVATQTKLKYVQTHSVSMFLQKSSTKGKRFHDVIPPHVRL